MGKMQSDESRKQGIALKIIHEKIEKNMEFAYDELCEEIINCGGDLKISNHITLKQYVQDLTDMGVLSKGLYNRYRASKSQELSKSEIHSNLLINALRLLDEEHRFDLCFDLYARLKDENKDRFFEKIIEYNANQ